MTLELWQVDAFADRPFAGNPAAVCLLDQARDSPWCQLVAMEMNLSETAFVEPCGDDYRLRWFTPAVEVDLCGHATLATAHVLWESGRLSRGAQARFHTRSGLLTADRQEDGWIVLDFPATPPEVAEAPEGLAQALGATPRWTGRSRFDLVVELADPDTVQSLTPDIARLAALPCRGIIVTAQGAPAGAPGVDFVSRFFGPASGVPEDPVTGSAHCALGPLWASRLGRNNLFARQVSRRGGEIRVSVVGDRVRLAGQAVTILRGQLLTT